MSMITVLILFVVGMALIPLILRATAAIFKFSVVFAVVVFIYWGVTKQLPGPLAELFPDDKIDQIVEFGKNVAKVASEEAAEVQDEIHKESEKIDNRPGVIKYMEENRRRNAEKEHTK